MEILLAHSLGRGGGEEEEVVGYRARHTTLYGTVCVACAAAPRLREKKKKAGILKFFCV